MTEDTIRAEIQAAAEEAAGDTLSKLGGTKRIAREDVRVLLCSAWVNGAAWEYNKTLDFLEDAGIISAKQGKDARI
jgi:hypothetical protein